MKLDIYKINWKKTAKKAELNSDVFGIDPNLHSIYLAVSSEMASLRQGTHSSKTKGEVSGTGAKPWKQKGTGRSRIGYLRNPSRVHGSKAFGPKPHSYKKKVNKKVKQLARRSVLSQRVIEKKLMIVEDFKIASFKTKELVTLNSIFEGATTIINKGPKTKPIKNSQFEVFLSLEIKALANMPLTPASLPDV